MSRTDTQTNAARLSIAMLFHYKKHGERNKLAGRRAITIRKYASVAFDNISGPVKGNKFLFFNIISRILNTLI